MADQLTGAAQSETSRFDQPGAPSRKAERAYAEKEYEHYQVMRDRAAQQADPSGDAGSGSGGTGPGEPTAPNFARTVDAVEEFGVDPSGGRSITDDIDSTPEDTLIVFPPGEYLLDGIVGMSGTKCGLVGAGYEEQQPPSGKETVTFMAPEGAESGINFAMSTGLFGNIVFDQSASGANISLTLGSSGFVQSRDVVFRGIVEPVGSTSMDQGKSMVAIQAESGATVRCSRFVMKYNGRPGTKNIGAGSAFWVGESNQGTAQIENCTVVGNASNGVYGGRTSGNVQVKAGTWRNNEVASCRYSGAESWVDGATIVIDPANYKGPPSDYGSFNGKIGIQAIQIERGDNGVSKRPGAQVRNVDIRIRSEGSGGLRGGITVLGSGGALKISNTRVVNQTDQSSVLAQAPGSGYSGYTAPEPHNIMLR
jgi:hypothetical protein